MGDFWTIGVYMSNNPLFIKSIKPLQTHNHAGSNVTYEMKW